jgi:hypothetical protein
MMLGRMRLKERTYLRKIRSRCEGGIMTGSISSPIYLGKPTTEVWRTDSKRERNRNFSLGLGQLDVFMKQNEKDKKQHDRHVERGRRMDRVNHDRQSQLPTYIYA